MNSLLNSGFQSCKNVNLNLTFNIFKTINHPKIIFQKNTLNSTLLNSTKRNFSVTPQNLDNFKPFGIKKNSKYNVYEGKNPQPINFKFYYVKPENSDIAAVSLLSSEQINGKSLKKVIMFINFLIRAVIYSIFFPFFFFFYFILNEGRNCRMDPI